MFVGIDVAKAELVVSLLPSAERFTVANDERGVHTLVERLAVVVQIGLGQPHRDVAVELRQVRRERAAALDVERRLETLVDDADGAADRLALGFDVALPERMPGLRDRLVEAVEQHRHELVRRGGYFTHLYNQQVGINAGQIAQT